MKKIAYLFIAFICSIVFMQCNSSTNSSTTATDSTSSTSTAKTDTANVTADWKLGVQMWTFRMFTFAEALDKVDSAGIKNIEAFWGQPLGAGMRENFGVRMSADSKNKDQTILQDKGISIVAMGVIVPKNKA